MATKIVLIAVVLVLVIGVLGAASLANTVKSIMGDGSSNPQPVVNHPAATPVPHCLGSDTMLGNGYCVHNGQTYLAK